MVIGGIGTLPGPVVGVLVFYALERLLADYGTVYLIVLGLIGIAIMASALVTLLLICYHFYRSFLADEGYLTFTLPTTATRFPVRCLGGRGFI